MKALKSGAILIVLLPFLADAQSLVRDTTLYFDFDKYEIKKEYDTVLSAIISQLNEDTTLTVEISGHADSKGKDAYNMKLSLKRTEMVIKFFHKEKISAGRIKGFHYGSSKPVASNETAEGRTKNRRVEIRVYGTEPEVAEDKPRIEIDVHYNKESFAYVDNRNRSIIHTVREAELIMEPGSFVLPERSALYQNDKVRLDFTELTEKGPMVLNSFASGKKGGALEFAYIFCLDSITNNGHAKVADGVSMEFLIPSGLYVEGSSMYYSPDHDRQNWTLTEKPKFNSFHNCYEVHVKDEGCIAFASEVEKESPVALQARYSAKSKGIKITEIPEFYFVSKDKKVIIAGEVTKEGEVLFKGLGEGEEGTIIGMVRSDPNNILLSMEDVKVKGHHNNGQVHVHGQLKFGKMNHFEFEKALNDLHKPSF